MRLDKLSGGQQQKVQLGVTIMNDPELLILDEPTKGFDPVNRRLLMDIIDDQKKAGSTVMMVTHQMEEVERLCDRVILLKDGVSRAYGTVAEVQEQFGGTVVHVDHDGVIPPSAAYTIVSDADGHAELEVTDDADPGAILRTIVDAGVTVRRFAPTRKSLDDIFVEVYGAENAGEDRLMAQTQPRHRRTVRVHPHDRQTPILGGHTVRPGAPHHRVRARLRVEQFHDRLGGGAEERALHVPVHGCVGSGEPGDRRQARRHARVERRGRASQP